MHRKLAALVFALTLPLWAEAGVAQERSTYREEEPRAPELAAGAWALTDLRSGEYLAGENASRRLPIASTTKIMLALVVLEDMDPEEEVAVSEEAAVFAQPLYSNIGLRVGDTLSVRELLMAALISSGDDAAYALAEHAGDGSVERFVGKMNRKAKELGLEDTRFENPVGFDAPGHYSTARDLAVMARTALRYPGFREIVRSRYAAITTPDREILLENTNDLLFSYPHATGVKTGTTPAAGPSLVASAADGDESYVSVVLNAEGSRFAATVEALEFGFGSFDREELVVRGERYAEAAVPYRRGESVDLVAARSVEDLIGEGARVEREVEVMEELPRSAEPGETLGEVVVRVDGERVGESPLVTPEGYERTSLWERLWYTVEGFFE
jgi:D-alanyl-D-alanine carboxypeptidase (penicillin-binding protein 5/6)